MLSAHIPCSTCGYELVVRSVSGECPECRAPIVESLRSTWLLFQPIGMLKILAAALACCAVAFCVIVAAALSEAETSALIAWIVLLVSGGLITRGTAAGMPSWQGVGRWHGWTSILLVCYAAFLLVVQVGAVKMTPGRTTQTLWLINSVVAMAWVLWLLLSLVVLLRRIPSHTLAFSAGWMTAIFSIAVVLLLLVLLPWMGLSMDLVEVLRVPFLVCSGLGAVALPILLIASSWRVMREIPVAREAQAFVAAYAHEIQ